MQDRAAILTDSKHDPLRRPVIYILLALALVSAVVLACRPALQREHHRLVLLRNQIEAAAAPDEPILVTDPLLARYLRWKGSAALRRQLYESQDGRWPGSLPDQPQEVIVVAAEADPLLSTLRANGYILTPDISQALSIERGNGFQLAGRGVNRIYFAVRSGAAGLRVMQPVGVTSARRAGLCAASGRPGCSRSA